MSADAGAGAGAGVGVDAVVGVGAVVVVVEGADAGAGEDFSTTKCASSSTAHFLALSPRNAAISLVLVTSSGCFAARVLCSFALLVRCQNVWCSWGASVGEDEDEDEEEREGRKEGSMTLKYPTAVNQYDVSFKTGFVR